MEQALEELLKPNREPEEREQRLSGGGAAPAPAPASVKEEAEEWQEKWNIPNFLDEGIATRPSSSTRSTYKSAAALSSGTSNPSPKVQGSSPHKTADAQRNSKLLRMLGEHLAVSCVSSKRPRKNEEEDEGERGAGKGGKKGAEERKTGVLGGGAWEEEEEADDDEVMIKFRDGSEGRPSSLVGKSVTIPFGKRAYEGRVQSFKVERPSKLKQPVTFVVKFAGDNTSMRITACELLKNLKK
jgi:hypothetical protein